jgi:glycerophosphoryl diester phosphodiesterase
VQTFGTRLLKIKRLVPTYSASCESRVRDAHARKLVVIPWTANDPRDWDALIAAGVDAIITDDPAALISHLRSKHLR